MRVLLIGGSSHAGKSSAAAILGAQPGWTSMSTDRMGRHPGRPWPVSGQPVKPHVVAHYTNLSQGELIRSVLTHYRNMWPSIRMLIEKHARDEYQPRLVLEGSGLLPESVASLDCPHVSAVWLTANETAFRRRMHGESRYEQLDRKGRALVDAFLGRTLRYDALMMEDVRKRGLPWLDTSGREIPGDIADAVLAVARPLRGGATGS